jgi:intracellular septation protein
MKFLLDLFPILLFFVSYKLSDIYTATGVLMAATVVQSIVMYVIERKLATMQKSPWSW